MTRLSRRKFLGLGAATAFGSLSGCVLSSGGSQDGTDVSELVSTHPSEGVSLSVQSPRCFSNPLFGNEIDMEVMVNARDSGEYWVRMAVVWDGATRSSDTETTTLVSGETAEIGLYQGIGADLDEVEEIIVGAGPVESNENPFAQGEDR